VNLIKSAATVGGMTMASRILGFVRDMLIARFLGTGPIADAFVVAFRFPNLFRRFFAEGAFNSAFVPLYAKRLEGEDKAAQEFASDAFSGLAAVLLIFTLIAIVIMPWFLLTMASGFLSSPEEGLTWFQGVQRLMRDGGNEKYDMAVLFARIGFPYLLFVSLVALLSGILNSREKFALAAAAPILLNIILIAAMLGFAASAPTPGHALIWGVLVAGIAQFAVLLWGVHRLGAMPKLRRPRWTPQMRRLVTLGIPGILAAGITQINIMVGTLITSFEASAVSILFYADRLYQLPLGLVGAAMGVVLLPSLSRALRAGDDRGALETMNRSVELSCLLIFPASVALFIIPREIVSSLFEYGQFSANDSARTSAAVAVFALGLPAFVLNKVFAPGFFAREDTKTPMVFAMINALINIILSYILFFRIGVVGIAVATSVAGWVNTGLLIARLWQQGHYRPDKRLLSKAPRLFLASLLMGGALFALANWLPGLDLNKVLTLALLVLSGMISYAVLVQLVGGARIQDLKAAFRKN
jgi:putative peptidoglycan lipid II flippase